MPFSVLDLAVIGVVIMSALLAAVRGFTREVLAIIAWVAAAAAAWFLHPLVLPTAKQYIPNATVALVAAIGGLFILTLIVVSIITVKVSDAILDSRIGALDHTLGFVFGAARGALICVIGWAFLVWLLQGREPEWAAQARSRPALESSRVALLPLLPGDPESLLKNLKRPRPDGEAAPPQETDTQPAAPSRRSDAGRPNVAAGTPAAPAAR